MPNLLPNEHELTIRHDSYLFGGSFLVILAMTMTMTINSNSVLLVRVASAGQYKRFEHVQKKLCTQHEYFSFLLMWISKSAIDRKCIFRKMNKLLNQYQFGTTFSFSVPLSIPFTIPFSSPSSSPPFSNTRCKGSQHRVTSVDSYTYMWP